jgi:hypothetical protein
LLKQFDYGKKFNPVVLTIEVGDEKIGIIDTTGLEERLGMMFCEPFGRGFYNTAYQFCFNDEEKKYLTEQNKAFAATFDPLVEELKDAVNNAEGIRHIKKAGSYGSSFTRVSGLSPVKAFKKVLSPKEYTYHRPDGIMTIEKKNENNHTFALVHDLAPSSKIFRAGMIFSGHNFKHEIGFTYGGQPRDGFEGIYPNTQQEVEYHAANLAAALKKAEAVLSEELLRLYGKSIV